MTREDLLSQLTPEQVEKARGCKSQEELLALAKKEGVELTDEQLSAISGAGLCGPGDETGFICPNCQSSDTVGSFSTFLFNSKGGYYCKCNNCGCQFEAKNKY